MWNFAALEVLKSAPKKKSHKNNQVNLINASFWLFLFLQIDRKWNFRLKKLGYYTKGITSEVCMCLWTHWKLSLARSLSHSHVHTHKHVHARPSPNHSRLWSQCYPQVNKHTWNSAERERETQSKERPVVIMLGPKFCAVVFWSVDWALLQTQCGPQNVSLIGMM